MNLQFDKVVEDLRGKILFLSCNQQQINIVEMKKGFSRGGHYHNMPTAQYVIYGKIEYREVDLETGKEDIRIVQPPSTIFIPAKRPHLLTALEDSVFLESFDHGYEATNYSRYRKIVEDKMKPENNSMK